MLQRAASNAYSWWWASHIRTKQSKWLEQNLQDMGEKVQIMLKLIEEDGDSFAKRAEMYYKKRPELIQFVEESYRAYRALAERYDHLSNELQNANRTIATVFPEQVQFSMEEEDEYAKSILPKKPSSAFNPKHIPKAPKDQIKDPKAVISSVSKRLQTKKTASSSSTIGARKSGLSKPQALEEINKLQKEILGLQTEKEFVKSSYENGLVKYWEMEEQIMEKHDRISQLQDEFGAGQMIDDDEARSLMAEAAIKSCHETLTQLQEKQGKTAQDAKIESKRLKDFWEKLSSLKNEVPYNQINQEKPSARDENIKAGNNLQNLEEEESCATQVRQDLELLREKVREQFESGSNASLSVTEMAEKVDELVDKVVNLESKVSSHAALVKRLRAENDDLQTQIRNLEDDKESLISDSGEKSKMLRDMEEKFDGVQELNKNVENQNNSLQTSFTEAQCSLDHLSEKLHDVKPDEEVETMHPSQIKAAKSNAKEERAKEVEHNPDGGFNKHDSLNSEKKPGVVVATQEEISDRENGSGKEKDILAASSIGHGETVNRSEAKDDQENLSKGEEQKVQDTPDENVPSRTSDIVLDTEKEAMVRGDEPERQHLFTSGLENKENHLLNEYTTVLSDYKAVNEKLDEIEKKDGDNLIDNQIRELRSANALKDDEIRSLQQRLSLMQRLLDENKDVKEENTLTSQQQTNVNLYTLLTSTSVSMTGGEKEDTKVTPVNQPQSISAVEEMFRMSIDELLEQNLDFWLRFSMSFGEIQKFETEVRDLLGELSKIEERAKKQDGSRSPRYNLKSDARPIYKHLREIHTELTMWVEKSVLLKDELKSRFASLCDIQEEITKALKESAEDDDFTFTSYQAAKFQGEVLNMKQENNKVADELQAGLDHVTTLQLQVERTLAKLNDEFKLSGQEHSESRSRVPLRSFIFGVKQKKQKPSLFACVGPALHKKYNTSSGISSPL